MKGLIIIIEVTKSDGKKLNQIIPDLVHCTYHKRHYYVTDCSKTWNVAKKIGIDVSRYTNGR